MRTSTQCNRIISLTNQRCHAPQRSRTQVMRRGDKLTRQICASLTFNQDSRANREREIFHYADAQSPMINSPLQTENFSLRQQLETLLQEARRNEDKMHRFDHLERRLIGSRSLLELVRMLLSEYKMAFAVEFVTLALVDRDYEATRILESDKNLFGLTLLQSDESLKSLYGDEQSPRLGDFDQVGHQKLFHAAEGTIASVALLPLTRQGQLIGSLHFGSADPNRYGSDCGTDFLERLGEVIAICLESAMSQERLKLVGLTDALTGVQNRRYLEHRCQVEVSQARRYKHPLTCLFLDLDKFKRINDTYGHQTGDEVLRSAATVIQTQLRSGDTIARYGGEEFVVLLPQAELQHARQIAERIRLSIEEKPLRAHSGHAITLTVSIGLSMLSTKELAQGDAQLAERLMAAADKALYQAKHSGRNRVVCDGSLSPGSGWHTPRSMVLDSVATGIGKLREVTSAAKYGVLKRLSRM